MTHFNLDTLIILTDDAYEYEDTCPGSGTPQPVFSQARTGPELAMFHKTHRGVDLYNTFSVFGWEAGAYHRIVEQGPRVEGPVAYMNVNATVLTAHKQVQRERILVEAGDTLTLRGTDYLISIDARGEARLTVVEPANA